MEERKYVVYVHINKTNLKVYVGQTGQSLQRRWRNGKGYLNCDTYFSNAIKKYGWESFEHIVLEEGLTKSEADFYENRRNYGDSLVNKKTVVFCSQESYDFSRGRFKR